MMGSRANTRRRTGVDGPPFLLDNRNSLLNFPPKFSSFSASLFPLFSPFSISLSSLYRFRLQFQAGLSLSPPLFFRGGLRASGSLFLLPFSFYCRRSALFISFVGRPHLRVSFSCRQTPEGAGQDQERWSPTRSFGYKTLRELLVGITRQNSWSRRRFLELRAGKVRAGRSLRQQKLC